MNQPTTLGIPCPQFTGIDDDHLSLRYRAWFWLYRNVRQARHRLGLCDWHTVHPEGGPVSGFDKCDWCGATRAQS